MFRFLDFVSIVRVVILIFFIILSLLDFNFETSSKKI
jgi:hypothetical protein